MSVYKGMLRGLSLLAALAILWVAGSSQARDGATTQVSQLQLPANSDSWINSPPLSTRLLQGKAVLFYLYEAG